MGAREEQQARRSDEETDGLSERVSVRVSVGPSQLLWTDTD